MSPQIGRYQVSGAGNSFAFAIDTITGQVWSSQQAEFAQPKAEVSEAAVISNLHSELS